jgi:peptidoglycan biosynthesis protein MviN/MurJ (putative lipid II flippase)
VVYVLFVVLPVFAILFALREPVVTVLLGHGQFTPDRVARTSLVLGVYILAFPMDVVGRIYIRFFIARQSTWVIAVAAAARLLVVGALAFALLHPLGLPGLALADGVGLTAVAVLLVLVADAHVGRTLRGAWWPVTRSLGLAIVGGWVAYLAASRFTAAGALAQVLVGSGAGAMAFLTSAWLVKAGELRELTNRLWPARGRGP